MQIHYLALLIFIVEAYGEDSCGWGKYGDKCDKDCPPNCISHPVRNLRHCQKETGKCSEGCVPGWFEDLCDHACGKNCLRNTCNRQNGICTFGCDGDYTGDFCNITAGTSRTPLREYSTPLPKEHSTHTPPTEKTLDLAAILVPGFLILIVVIAVVVFMLRKRKRGKNRRIPNALAAIIPRGRRTNTASSADEEERFLTEQGRESFPNVPERKIADIQRVFVETESFEKIKERLERLGHVIICGDQGEGKTATALMLGAEYVKQGYELVLVEDVDKAQLSDYREKSRDVCVIFDDLFKTVRSYIDVPRLRHFLYDLHVLLAQCEARSERRYFIFTAETSNLKCALSMLKHHQLFQRCSENILTNTTSLCYTHEEKEAIWMKHKRHYNCRTDVQENRIIAFKGTNVGFPLVCKLFSRYAGFQTCHERFFENPLVCIKEELQTIISLLDDKSAALILLLLCEGQLNISQLEAASDPGLEAHFQAVATLVKTSARQDVVKALRTFCGTICTEGNTIAFSHSMIYDVCVSVLFSIEPEFTLKHCSIKFILEHVHDEKANISPVREQQLLISTSGAHRETIVDRLTDSLVSGASSEYMLHPIWKTRTIADKLSQMTKTPGTLSYEAKHNILHYACITWNKTILQRLLSLCEINRRGLNGWTPLMYAVVSGQVNCFNFLVKNIADITLCDSSKNNLMHLACQHGALPTVKHVNKVLKELPKNLYIKRYLNGQGLNDWTPVMCAVLSGEKNVVKFLIKLKVDLTLRNINNNTVFDIASLCGNSSAVECLLRLTDKK